MSHDSPRATAAAGAAAVAGAFGREINREGRDGGMVLLVEAAATIGRYHNERWCCGMSVYKGFVFNVSSGAVAAGIADGAFPRSTDEWNDGRTGTDACTLMSRRGRRRRHHCRDRRRWRRRSSRNRLIRDGAAGGQIGGRTLRHETGDHRRRGCGTITVDRRQDPRRRRAIADQAILTADSAGRQDHRTVADLSDRRYETILTYYTSCHTVTVATRYKTNGITIATADRMYTAVVADAAAVGAILLMTLLTTDRRDDRDFAAQSVRRRPRVVLFLLLDELSRLK